MTPKLVLHYRIGGQRPACRRNEWTGMARADLTANAQDVTCKRCIAVLKRVALKIAR